MTGLCQYPQVFDFSTLQCVLVCYMDPVILNIQNFGFHWHDKLRLKLTIFSALLLYALRCWNTLTLFSFLIPVLVFSVFSVKFSCSVVSDSLWPCGQAYLSITNSQSLLKLMSIESVMPSSYLIHPLSSPSPPAFHQFCVFLSLRH